MQPFEDVVAEYGPMVLRVCRAVLGPVDADDAWSETFLSAHARLSRPRPGRQRRGLAGDDRAPPRDRRRTQDRASPTPAEHLPEELPQARNPTADDPDLWAALESLPEKQRKAVAYHYLAGLPYAEVAELLGNSPDAARRAAADGIKTLRTNYRKDKRS